MAPYASLPAGSPARLLRQVAAWLVPGSADIEPLADPTRAGELVDLAQGERLLGPLLVAVDAGALELPAEVVERLVEQHEQAMLWCLHLETRLLEIADWFDHAGGVEFRVLKGAAVAHLDDVDPSLRFFADIDLLIAANDMDAAIVVLESHDADRHLPQRRPGFDRRFGKGVGMRCADGVEVDIHRTLTGRAHGFRIPLDALFADPEPFPLGGRAFQALSAPHRTLNAAYHAIAGSPVPPLRTLRDLAGYMTRPDLGPEAIAPIADDWRGTAVLAEALAATLDAFSFDAPAWRDWLAAIEVDPTETALLMRGRRPIRLPVEWTTVRELSWRDRAAFLWAVGAPSAEVLQQRGVGPVTRIRRGLRRTLGGATDRRSRQV